MVWVNSLFCYQYINEYIISLHLTVGKGKNCAIPPPHLKDTISILSVSSGSGENQWHRQKRWGQSLEHLFWVSQCSVRRNIKGVQCHFSWYRIAALLFWSHSQVLSAFLSSWQNTVTVSLSRDLTSSAVVSHVQTDPKLCCFNYSLSYLISLLVSVNTFLSLSNPLWQRLGVLGAENLHQGNKEAASTSKPANSRLLTLTYDYNTPGIAKTQITSAPKTEKYDFSFYIVLFLKGRYLHFQKLFVHWKSVVFLKPVCWKSIIQADGHLTTHVQGLLPAINPWYNYSLCRHKSGSLITGALSIAGGRIYNFRRFLDKFFHRVKITPFCLLVQILYFCPWVSEQLLSPPSWLCQCLHWIHFTWIQKAMISFWEEKSSNNPAI